MALLALGWHELREWRLHHRALEGGSIVSIRLEDGGGFQHARGPDGGLETVLLVDLVSRADVLRATGEFSTPERATFRTVRSAGVAGGIIERAPSTSRPYCTPEGQVVCRRDRSRHW